VLYQLSYTHHWFLQRRAYPAATSVAARGAGLSRRLAQTSVAGSAACMYFAAIARAVSLSGPGCGTNSASR
jgi:hypothetical protein